MSVPRLFLYLVVIACLVTTGACALQPVEGARALAPQRGLLWKIEKAGIAPAYLLATIHLEDPRVTRLPESVARALGHSDALVLEVDLGPDSRQLASRAMFFNDGRSLPQVVGESLFRQSLAALRARGFQPDHVRLMKPWAVFSILSMPQAETGQFLDAVLYQRATQRGLPVYALERMSEQIAVFEGLSVQDQIVLLRDTLANKDAVPRFIDETLQVYLRGDLSALLALNERYMEFTEPAVATRVSRRLLDDRNRRMLVRLESLLQRGQRLFIAVGALHLPGETGLLQGLRQRGYRLSAVYPAAS